MPTQHMTGDQYIVKIRDTANIRTRNVTGERYIKNFIPEKPAQMDICGVDVIVHQNDSAATRGQLLMSMSFDS